MILGYMKGTMRFASIKVDVIVDGPEDIWGKHELTTSRGQPCAYTYKCRNDSNLCSIISDE
jgi:hypothetical protein